MEPRINQLGSARRAIIAHSDSDFLTRLSRQLRRMGWAVHTGRSGSDARRLVHTLAPAVVILGTEFDDESGWLTCAKLRHELPEQQIILVAFEPTPERQRLAQFVGAESLAAQSEEVLALIDAVYGSSELALR
jgi:DNA-binding response OmpR family regulator